jgi:Sigma-70, region 4
MSPTLGEREREMYRLRVSEGLTLRELGQRFGVGPERARQLLNRYVRQTTGRPVDARAMSRTAAAVRRAGDLARAQAQAEELLAAWREGQEVEQIAKAFGLRCMSVAQVIRTEVSSVDRAALARARTRSRETACDEASSPG